MEFSNLQKKIIESQDNKMVVISRAATGKTRCLTERVRYWLRNGVAASDICAITFTNLASNEMQVRLGDDYKDGIFIGTIHALAARFLINGGYIEKVGMAIDEEKFDEFFKYIKKYPDCIEHYSYILVDEAQDLGYDEYNFIFNMIKPENFFVVGDPFQCIYERLKQASPVYMSKLIEMPGVSKYDLNENYRNKANILTYAQTALKPLHIKDNSIAMTKGGMVFEGKFNADLLVDWINKNDTFKDWAVLCYTNAEVEFIMKTLNDKSIPVVNFNQRQKTKAEIDKLINQNKVKVLTIWGAKGLGFPNVAIYGFNWMTKQRKPEVKKEAARVNYVAYTRAMNALMVFN